MHPDRRREGRAIRKQLRHIRQMNARLRELGEAARKVSRKFDYLNRLLEGNPTP